MADATIQRPDVDPDDMGLTGAADGSVDSLRMAFAQMLQGLNISIDQRLFLFMAPALELPLAPNSWVSVSKLSEYTR